MMTDRPALYCPGQPVQPVAGEQTWPWTKQSIWPKQKGVTRSSRHVLKNNTGEYLCTLHCSEVLCVPLQLSVVSLPPNAIFKPHHTQ